MKITKHMLDVLIDRINTKAGAPLTPYTRTPEGNIVANIGNYHLDCAYGGYQLCVMQNNGGGIHNITSGYDTKKDMYYQLQAFLAGMEAVKQ